MKCADGDLPGHKPHEIPYAPGAWLEYVGFARPKNQRQGQSGSSLVDRQPTGRAICGHCAMKRVHGLSDGQGSLL